MHQPGTQILRRADVERARPFVHEYLLGFKGDDAGALAIGFEQPFGEVPAIGIADIFADLQRIAAHCVSPELLGEAPSVGQSGERVVVRLERQLLDAQLLHCPQLGVLLARALFHLICPVVDNFAHSRLEVSQRQDRHR